MSDSASLLHLVDLCDNFHIKGSNDLIPFYHSESADKSAWIGRLKPIVIEALKEDNERQITAGNDAPWIIKEEESVSFAAHIDTAAKRSVVMKRLCEGWRDAGRFAEQISPRLWRDEILPVYYSPFVTLDEKNVCFTMERAACPLFGTVQFGVHMTIYTPDFKIWVPRRAQTKQTFPGKLDNTVAGGIPYGISPLESLFKEAMEEASLPEDLIKPYVKAAGGISYTFITSKGWLKPEFQHIYDMCLPSSDPDVIAKFTPKPLDGEVESFQLCDLEDVIAKMRNGEFKPNCAVVLLDFFIRHGHLTAANEPNFLEILTRIHGRFGYT